MNMKVRWQWKWNEIYLTRTRKGERKRRGTERTPTQHTWPGTGKPRKKKEKRRPTDDGTRPAEGGEGRKRLNQPNTAKTYAYLGTRRTKPTWRGENARTHEKRDPWGISWWRCIHMNVQIPLVRLYGPDSSQPYGRLKLSTPELRAQLNLTNDQKRKKHHTCKHVLLPDHVSMPDMWSISWAALKKEVVVVASSYAKATGGWGIKRPGTAAHCSTLIRPTCETRKMASCCT